MASQLFPSLEPATSCPTSTLGCRPLWFAGMSEGHHSACINDGGYAQNYAAALGSAPRDVLQPVLMLKTVRGGSGGRLRNLSRLGAWARVQGAHVIQLERLSFEEPLVRRVRSRWKANIGGAAGGSGPWAPELASGRHNDEGHPLQPAGDDLAGPYLRLEVPRLARVHGLYALPCVCADYALYTDTDVLFWSVTAAAVAHELERLGPNQSQPFVMYGREKELHGAAIPVNTGVFFMHVPRFEAAWPRMLRFGLEHQFDFPAYDQGWLNAFFRAQRGATAMLPVMCLCRPAPSAPQRHACLHDGAPACTRSQPPFHRPSSLTAPLAAQVELEGLLAVVAAAEGRARAHRPLPRAQARARSGHQPPTEPTTRQQPLAARRSLLWPRRR